MDCEHFHFKTRRLPRFSNVVACKLKRTTALGLILRMLLETRAYFSRRERLGLFPFWNIESFQDLIGSVQYDSYVSTKKGILWLKLPANLRDLILKKAMRLKTCATDKCFWDTHLANRF